MRLLGATPILFTYNDFVAADQLALWLELTLQHELAYPGSVRHAKTIAEPSWNRGYFTAMTARLANVRLHVSSCDLLSRGPAAAPASVMM